MKAFDTLEFDPSMCRRELDELGELLASKRELSEREDIKPFFAGRRQLTGFLSSRIPDLFPANRIAYEFQIFGDFAADAVIGNFDRKKFCAIEFEEARANSVFTGKRAEREWARSLEHGFGQIIDWFYAFDRSRTADGFTRNFGYGHVDFVGMLVVGRNDGISEREKERLHWRTSRVDINKWPVYCLTYDDLYESLQTQWEILSLGAGVK